MASDSWKIVECWKNKLQGQVWKVRDASGRTGYFKFARPDQWFYSGPLVGNEWLAKRLADELRLNAAPVEPVHIHFEGADLYGIVSLPAAASHTCWRALPERVRRHAQSRVHRMRRLLGVIAFDAWLTNIDRGSGSNIILYKDSGSLYRWYLIDHAYALYGSPRKWSRFDPMHRHWQQIWQFCHVPRGFSQLADRESLLDMARRIGDLSPSYLRDAVAAVPDPGYTDRIKRDVYGTLLYRRTRLANMLDRWLRFDGSKESAV